MELALATAEEMTANLGKQSIRKNEVEIQINAYLMAFNQAHIPKKVKIGYFLEYIEQYVPAPWGISNIKNMDTTGKLAEEDRHKSSVVKKKNSGPRGRGLLKGN